MVLFLRQMAAEGVNSRDMTVHWHQIGYLPRIEVGRPCAEAESVPQVVMYPGGGTG